jgi:hypothetical protein
MVNQITRVFLSILAFGAAAVSSLEPPQLPTYGHRFHAGGYSLALPYGGSYYGWAPAPAPGPGGHHSDAPVSAPMAEGLPEGKPTRRLLRSFHGPVPAPAPAPWPVGPHRRGLRQQSQKRSKYYSKEEDRHDSLFGPWGVGL